MTPMERYEAALAGKATDQLPCHPITMLFSSHLIGRKFYDYVIDYRVMVEGQLRMVEQFGVDCVQTISDPCREVHDLGGKCTYFEDEAPANERQFALLQEKADLAKLKLPDPLGGGRMHDRVKGVAAFREKVGKDMSVQGWVEGPMAMGVDLRGMDVIMMDTFDDPAFVNDLFAFTMDMEIAFAKVQVQAGADTIGIGDAAASLVSEETYRTMILPHEKRLVDAIHAMGAKVRLHICGRTTHEVNDMGTLGCDYVDIDFLCDLTKARAAMPRTAILGNLEPSRYLLQGTPQSVYDNLAECHRICGSRFIVGAGCEVPKFSPHENVHALVRYAKEHRNLAA
ncbi:MAG: uroporphyrinogen decarboxylase [Verrucomicrobia bacterium]|nr:uroporphyrinogen decarboxylase [Verrucomicrobiota bacterium]